MSDRTIERLAEGALAGAVATIPMSLVMAAGRGAGLLRQPPPRQIMKRAERKTGTRHDLDHPAFQTSWVAAHVGYGAGAGAIYALLNRLLPIGTIPRGLIFGGLVWAVSYLGLMPSLGLYPWPHEDRKSRVAVMILAHAIYGLATAETAGFLGGLDRQRLSGR
jgi:hypothetical protein